MIAKTTTGRSFDSALGYGAADLTLQQRQHKQPKVALLDSYNLISYHWQGMAAEMAAVAQGSRCTTPVWHTSLSAQPGEQLSADQWRAAARQYCTAMGADPAQHQVAIFQHHDTAHAHVHIYINRVRLDDGPALDTSHNYARNVKTTRQIEQELSLQALPEQRTSLRDHSGQTQANRSSIATILGQVLAEQKPTTLAELTADLAGKGITTQLATNSKGIYGISFRQGDGQPVKGSAVGYKYRQLATQLAANRAEYQAEIERLKHELEQKPAVVEIVRPDPADQKRIAELTQQVKRHYTAYIEQKKQADQVPDLSKAVKELYDINTGLLDINHQQQAGLEQEQGRYREMAEKFKAHIEKYNELARRFNELKQKLQARPPVSPPPADKRSESQVSPGTGTKPSAVDGETSSKPTPAFYAAFAKRIQDHMPYLSLNAFTQKVGNPHTVGPKLKLTWHQDELWVTDGKDSASLKALGFTSKQLNFSQLDLKNLKERKPGQGKSQGPSGSRS